MPRGRQRVEIITSILDAANGGIMKTKLRYIAKLDDGQFNGYITYLLESGLLAYEKSLRNKIIRTTPKGLRILYLYNQLLNLTGESNNLINGTYGIPIPRYGEGILGMISKRC
jgi:predicted transcriptional regulator